MRPVLQSTNERPAPCRHNIWVEQPPSAELPARCAFYISCFGHTQPTPFEPAPSAGRGTFSRLRGSFCEQPVADFAGSASPIARGEPIAIVVRSFEPDERHLQPRFPSNLASHMDHLSGYAHRPFPFVLRYLRQRLWAHLIILTAVVAAVTCSVGTQYGVKFLVDSLSAGPALAGNVWLAFIFLMSLIAADNFLWRIASWTASITFVRVTGDLRRDIFRHLTGHAPSYFSDRMPGMLTSRITATSNAVFTVDNMIVWNVLPPCIATFAAIALIGTVSPYMALGLIVIAGGMVVAMFRLAAAGKPLHDDFADKAAVVDGEMIDVISN